MAQWRPTLARPNEPPMGRWCRCLKTRSPWPPDDSHDGKADGAMSCPTTIPLGEPAGLGASKRSNQASGRRRQAPSTR